jgi:hypothetical protein
VGFDLLLHLDLLMVPFLVVELCPETSQLLCVFGGFVDFAGKAFALSLFMIETKR